MERWRKADFSAIFFRLPMKPWRKRGMNRPMDQIVHRVLRFDRFPLDLTRGCLRAGEQDIDLRPKAFEVLRHLTENAGRLVSKEELFEAAWPRVTVADDSLVQCIRELREKLGDGEHRLIKTVPRRGYLLDATPTLAGAQSLSDELALKVAAESPESASKRSGAHRIWRTVQTAKLRTWGAAGGGILMAFAMLFVFNHLSAPGVRPDKVSLADNPTIPFQSRTFRDCELCPEMIALPAGEFLMGSPDTERGRQQDEGSPRHVTIARSIAIGRFEITVSQFSAFVAETGLMVGNLCRLIKKFDGSSVGWGPAEASFRQTRLRSYRNASCWLRQLARSAGLCRMAETSDWQAVSPADRGGMGICR